MHELNCLSCLVGRLPWVLLKSGKSTAWAVWCAPNLAQGTRVSALRINFPRSPFLPQLGYGVRGRSSHELWEMGRTSLYFSELMNWQEILIGKCKWHRDKDHLLSRRSTAVLKEVLGCFCSFACLFLKTTERRLLKLLRGEWVLWKEERLPWIHIWWEKYVKELRSCRFAGKMSTISPFSLLQCGPYRSCETM